MVGDLLMLGLVIFLAAVLVYRAAFTSDNAGFFDKANTNALRGFWCLIIILVHVPAGYQNRLQDMLGSFAYVGVTFFFMTSAYGLKRGFDQNPASIRGFWKRRLPKLLVPCLLINLLTYASRQLLGLAASPWLLLLVNGWVRWLLVCYLAFWVIYRFLRPKHPNRLLCAAVAGISIVSYVLEKQTTVSVWPTEIFGFAWGILLARDPERFRALFRRRWAVKVAAACAVAAALGIAYLKYKTVLFLGDYLLKIALGAAILTFMLALNARISIGNPVSRYLGKISYEVYLVHGAVFVGIDAVCAGQMSSGLFIATGIALTILMSALVHLLSGRLLHRVGSMPRR